MLKHQPKIKVTWLLMDFACSDNFCIVAMDDDTLAVALGYTCHLVSMIAKFLELPLRYPVNFHGSKSTVMDFTSEKVPEKDRKLVWTEK